MLLKTFNRMPVHISFLRGVNMTGHNKMKMADLAALYQNLGFRDAVTFIQSGNVVFSSVDDFSVPDLLQKIEKGIKEKFGYDVPVMIRSVDELKSLIPVNPYLSEKDFDPSKMAVVFLHDKASVDQIGKVKDFDYPPDKFTVNGSEIFIFCPNGFGRTKLYTNFFEKKMGVTGTARNWNTVLTLLDMAVKMQG
jgi:uncharacterized protein (DUF1697 family)